MIILCVILGNLHAQDSAKFNFLEFRLSLLQPLGSIQKAFLSTDFNIGGEYHRQITTDKPIFLGIFLDYSKLSTTELTVQEFIDFNLFDVSYATSTNLINFGGTMRFYPDISFLKLFPFLEGNVGGRWFYTLTNRTLTDSSTSTSTMEKGNVAPCFSMGIGVHTPISDEFFITGKAAYSYALSTTYLYVGENLPLIDSSLDGYKTRRSNSEFVLYSIGISYRFSKLLPN
ncbi:MAG: hypothetical protein R2774_10440 [Saprospiraceae bacterium]